MINSEFPEPQTPKSEDPELKILRNKIIEAIVYSENFWMIYKYNTFGMAGFLDLHYKKSYIEILFFTPKESKRKRKNRLFQIISPLLRELNFKKIFEKPKIDSDGIINPLEIYKKIENLVKNEIQAYLYILDNQISKINEEYENYPVNNNPYVRKIFVYLGDITYQFKIDFEFFPKRPLITFSKQMRKTVKEEDFLKSGVMTSWTEETPFSIPYLIEELMNFILKKKNNASFDSNTQHLILNDVVISKNIPEISIRVHRGETFGIIYSQKNGTLDKDNTVLQLYRSIAGTQKPTKGEISVFDQQSNFSGISIISSTLEQDLESSDVKKAVSKNITITTKLNEFSRKKQLVNEILEVSGLKNKLEEKISDLPIIDRIKIGVCRALLQSPTIIMISIPDGALGRLDTNQFNRYLKKIASKFHVITIVYGPRTIVANCDKILNIADNKADSGSIEDLVLQIPQSGEVIIIELNNLNPDALNREVLSSLLGSAIIIEERQNEKYKIFSKENPDDLIIKLMNIIGPFIYNFKRFKPTLAEYLEFVEENQ